MSGVTNDYGQKAFNRAGSCIFEVYDPVLTGYRYMGKVTGLSYTPESTKIQQRASVSGMSRVTQERTTAIEGMLSFTFGEQMTPSVAQLLFGDPSVDQSETATTVVGDKQAMTLYNTDPQFVANEYGLVPNVDAGTVSAGTPVASGSGTWSSAPQYFWVSAIYGDASAITTSTSTSDYAAALDIDFTEAAVMSASVTVTPSGIEAITLGTIATTGPTPDYWIVWTSTSDTIAGSTIVAVLAGSASTTALMADAGSGATYEAAIGIGVQDISAYSTGTATYNKMTVTTDFLYDSANGNLKRVSDGGLDHGEDVRVSTWTYDSDIVTTSIGAPISNQDTRQVRVTSFEGEIDKLSTDPLIAEGERFIFYRVNFSGTQPNYSYTEADFHEGAGVEVNCQYDSTQSKIAVHQGWSRKFASFVQNFE